MDAISYKTSYLNSTTAQKEWLLVDAQDLVLGRLSSQIAIILRGKHKPGFTPHADCGDNVIVVNAEKVKLTGNKELEKQYVRHTGYPGGQRFTNPTELLEKHPERLIELAVRRMLPKNRLGREVFGNLYVYAGTTHPHEGQQPKPYQLKDKL